jgi:hypothetical protein
LASPGAIFAGAVEFMPDEGCVPWLCVVAPPPAEDGAFCIAAPPDSRAPVPCALAAPVPAISASAATEIKKRLAIRIPPHIVIARADNGRRCETFRAIRSSTGFVSLARAEQNAR